MDDGMDVVEKMKVRIYRKCLKFWFVGSWIFCINKVWFMFGGFEWEGKYYIEFCVFGMVVLFMVFVVEIGLRGFIFWLEVIFFVYGCFDFVVVVVV